MTDASSLEKGAIVVPTTPTSSIPAEPFDRSAERRLIRKLDLRIIPVLWTLQLVSFVDRANIGNAKIAGMEKELELIGNNRYNTAIWIFNLGYLIAGVPIMMLFKRYGPRVLSTMMFLWAICVIGCGVSKTWYQLVVCRFLEGCCEAAYVGSAAYLIGAYYTKAEYLTRYTIFFTAGIIAGAFNGFLSSLLSKMDGTAGYKAWRWIFIIEGIITIVVAIGSWWLIVPFPEDCTFLTPDEKELMLARVKEDSGHDSTEPPINFQTVLHHLKDWKVWAAVLMNMGVTENANSIANFQPTILRGIGYKGASAQVHTIPVYITGAVFSVSLAYVSRYLNHRYAFYMLGWAILAIGLSIEIAYPAGNIRYMGMFFLASGAYLSMPISIVWVSINSGKGYKRAVTLGAIVNFGTAGAFVSSNVFKSNETPRFHTGFSTGLGMACMGALAATITFFGCMWENKRRDRKRAELPEIIEGDASRDNHPDFRFVY